MFIERLNRSLNKISNFSEIDDYKKIVNSMIESYFKNNKEILIDDLIKEKIKNLNSSKKSYIKTRLIQIKDSIKNLYKKEVEYINFQIEILIKNQRKINSFQIEGEKEVEKLINYLKNLYIINGEKIAELYSIYLEKLKNYIEKLEEITVTFNKEQETHILKLLIYNYYFTLKLIEEEHLKYKEKVNNIVDKLNKETFLILEKIKLKNIEKLKEKKKGKKENIFDEFI
ncbi:MAG: hypothetical protein ABGW69_02125 [Nanoarchaeota archaeon]